MRDHRKVYFGLAIGLPYLLSAHSLVMQAIKLGRDLTATGIAVGSISVGVAGLVGIFVYGNVREHQAKAAGEERK